METHQIKEGTPFYNWAMLRRGLGKTLQPHKSMFNPIKIDIEKKHLMSLKDQGVEGDGFTRCLINSNTLSLIV